jgi:hypothetical protein
MATEISTRTSTGDLRRFLFCTSTLVGIATTVVQEQPKMWKKQREGYRRRMNANALKYIYLAILPGSAHYRA